MKQNKLVIVVLIILAVLFALGQSANLLRDKKENKFSLDKAKKYIGFIDRAMARFSPVLDSGRLKNSVCKTVDKPYTLTNEDACDINIDESKDKAKFEKAILTVKPDNVKVKVPYPKDEPCPETTKDRTDPNQHLELSVVYIPKGGKEEKKKCVVTGDVNLMVLEKGGTLRLQCKGCNQKSPVTVTLK